MDNETWLEDELKKLKAEHLLRSLRTYPAAGGRMVLDGKPCLNFSSNDYLDLARHPAVAAFSKNALDQYGAGAAASRLVSGSLPLHDELETQLAAFKGYPSALVFGSGFLANTGNIPALAGRADAVFADRLAHASLIDAIKLSGAGLERFRHNDPEHLKELLAKAPPHARKLIVTESVFSMDGDLAPLPDLAGLAASHGAMFMVDEAHATGVYGPGGRGLVSEHELQGAVNLSMGTLSKALGGYGGFVACSEPMREWLVNKARTFIYSTALPPSVLGAALGALTVLQENPALGKELLRRADLFRDWLKDAGLNTLQSASQIIPILVGENDKALRMAERLRQQGLIAVAIRPPTVPKGTARLRLSITLAHSEADLKRAAEIIISCAAPS
ncbi:MAG: 8-amino-7-oxononanoate synthase [Lentisphaerota bacterium]